MGVAVWRDKLGFKQGVASARCFYHEERDIRVVVHGDDFTALCTREQSDWLVDELKKHFELKVSGRLGGDTDDDLAVRILNRTVGQRKESFMSRIPAMLILFVNSLAWMAAKVVKLSLLLV